MMANRTLILHAHQPIFNSNESSNQTQLLNQDEEDSSIVSSAANAIGENQDLLDHILVRLPGESLIRFQFVSKIWLRIISDHKFRRRLCLPRHIGANFLFRKGIDGEAELNYVSRDEGYVDSMHYVVSKLTKLFGVDQIIGFHSCNGLVALALESNVANGDIDFVVYNPTTRLARAIQRPPLPVGQTRAQFVALIIAYDPSQSEHYKLLYVWDNGIMIKFACFASGPMVWINSTSNKTRPREERINFEKGVYWNREIFWVDSYWRTFRFDFQNCLHHRVAAAAPAAITALRREREKYWPEISFFGVSGGDLCVMGLTDPRQLLFEMYKMESDYSRWNLKYCVDLSPLPRRYPSMIVDDTDPHRDRWPCKFSVLSCPESDHHGRKPPLEMLISAPGKIIWCNMQDGTVKEIADVLPVNTSIYEWRDISIFEWSTAFDHIETFASV